MKPLKKTFGHTLLFYHSNEFIYDYYRQEERGGEESCLTPSVAVITTAPIIDSVTLYMATEADNIIISHPIRFRIVNSLLRETRSYALLKSMKVAKSFSFLRRAVSVSSRRVTMCCVHPRVLCASACSRDGQNHWFSL